MNESQSESLESRVSSPPLINNKKKSPLDLNLSDEDLIG